MPIELELPSTPAAAKAAAPAPWYKLGSRPLGVRDRMLFTERLALLLETGVPLHTALQSLHEQSEQPAQRAMITAMSDDILAGERFSSALGRHALFPSAGPVAGMRFPSSASMPGEG